jgi:sugar phosphate isomerase/epimerase
MRPLGFSTGAIARNDFRKALRLLRQTRATAVELSALRQSELEPLIDGLGELDLSGYTHISVHLPSSIEAEFESHLLELLNNFQLDWLLITHPNVISQWDAWRRLGERVCIENMDKRKAGGQTAVDLLRVFEKLPDATFCFDLGHAYQVDPTMGEAVRILEELHGRLRQLHVSEVNSESRHDPISLDAQISFGIIVSLIPPDLPAILECRLSTINEIKAEMDLAARILSPSVQVAAD